MRRGAGVPFARNAIAGHSFPSWEAFEAHLDRWEREVANVRIHGTTGEEDGFQEQAAMICPCGCRSVLHMNLLPDERPCWRVTRHDDGTATLHPSVWRKKECGSHFWFRNGRVVWC